MEPHAGTCALCADLTLAFILSRAELCQPGRARAGSGQRYRGTGGDARKNLQPLLAWYEVKSTLLNTALAPTRRHATPADSYASVPQGPIEQSRQKADGLNDCSLV